MSRIDLTGTEVWMADTTLCLKWPSPAVGQDGYRGLCGVLRRLRLTVGPVPRIVEQYKSLTADYRQASRDGLECEIHNAPAMCHLEFYQDLVHVNPAGGRYDFSREAKMPYVIRLRWRWTVQRLRAWLEARGAQFLPPKIPSPNPDPLAWFNSGWDGDYERRRGIHRFARDESGWPDAKELSSWDRRDADGQILEHGAVRYWRDRRGYLIRGRVYGGINGMWTIVYGPGQRDYAQVNGGRLFTCRPLDVPRKAVPTETRKKRLDAELAQAVKRMDFERAAVLRDLLGIHVGEPVEARL